MSFLQNFHKKFVSIVAASATMVLMFMPLAQAASTTIQNVTIGSVAASPAIYYPSTGLLNLSYSLSNSSGGADISAEIFKTSDLDVPVKNWGFANQSNGRKNFTWDGKDDSGKRVPDGDYVFKVSGTDGSFIIEEQSGNFTVSSVPIQTKCAGFSDIDANNADCPAVSYVKNIGAMTGNPDGTFAPQGSLQRDQMMKIVLVTFKKFNAQTDYCAGTKPFPDVTQTAWSFQYICQAKTLAITTGYLSGPDAGFYRPSRSVNRIEFLAVVLRNISDVIPQNTVPSYADVELNQWFTGFARYAYDNNLFNHPNLFPTNFMVRVEVARVLFKLHQMGKI